MIDALRPVTLEEAREAVRRWHSHHKPHRAQIIAIGYEQGGALVAVSIVERPKAVAHCNGRTWELTRMAVAPDLERAGEHANGIASCLARATWRCAASTGVRRLVSSTRQDEDGTCYRAAGWVATALTKGRPWTSGNKSMRWLPGLYVPSTEIVDRVRWEIGPDAATTRVKRGPDGVWAYVEEPGERVSA